MTRRWLTAVSLISLIGTHLTGCAGLHGMPLQEAVIWVVCGALVAWVLTAPAVLAAWSIRRRKGLLSRKSSISFAGALGGTALLGLLLLDSDLAAICLWVLILLLLGVVRALSSERSLSKLLLDLFLAAVVLGTVFLLDVRGPGLSLYFFRAIH